MANVKPQQNKLGRMTTKTSTTDNASTNPKQKRTLKSTIKSVSNGIAGVALNVAGGVTTVIKGAGDIIHKVDDAINKAARFLHLAKEPPTIDMEAMNGRNNIMSVVDVLHKLSKKEKRDFTKRNAALRERLMLLNEKNQDITLNALGINVPLNGDSKAFPGSVLQTPCYAKKLDYIANFVASVRSSDTAETTQSSTISSLTGYEEITNYYPDEDGTGDDKFGQKWNTDNPRSLLKKHKKLYEEHKINSLISRFHTYKDAPKGVFDSKTQFGLSRGRNLLTADAERGKGGYVVNGYENPYCRVWTHHHQYDRLSRLIRPFQNEEGEGVEPFEYHKWANFKINENDTYYESGTRTIGPGATINGLVNTKTLWGWKNNNGAWRQSVLGKNGFINIVPKFQGSGRSDNLHTKQCMFSIENLAWKDYNPYSFEKALSYEQRGPMGGRIMWFPPYGIQFNETTTAQWQNNTFIGRGEDVYTYTNTVRTGTLNFILLVDHPSLLDYVSWGGRNQDGYKDVSNNDINRFFAGCDDMAGVNGSNQKGGGLADYAVPTPLTDEYVEYKQKSVQDAIKNEIIPEPPQEIPNNPPKTITFYVFYPNNYTGCDDIRGTSKKLNQNVDPIAYLLLGTQAQKVNEGKGDLVLTLDNLENAGNGYEMIVGKDGALGDREPGNYVYAKKRGRSDYNKWYYRVDKETENQILTRLPNYTDNNSYGLNSNAEEVKKAFKLQNDNLISFAQFASIKYKNIGDLLDDKGVINEINEDIKNCITGENGYKLTSINVTGYSNSHDNSKWAKDRNTRLAIQRAETVGNWLNSVFKNTGITSSYNDPQISVQVAKEDKINTSGLTTKQYRCARVDLTYSLENTSLVSETSHEDESITMSEYIGFSKHIADDGTVYYINENETNPSLKNERWFLDEENHTFVKETLIGTIGRANDSSVNAVLNNTSDSNKLRYDQEYHFFRMLKEKDRSKYEEVMQKIQYFNPAFHSMTPEGFSARLTFLHQCTRQGNTVSGSDWTAKSANNLAFGRPPYCVLRLGDFFHQMIIIDNISINYDPLVWDLNTEGCGVIPLLANVSISFKFIGGASMYGAVTRLQNAQTFNYYANANLYDNRSDRPRYDWDSKTCGAIHNKLLPESYFYSTENYKPTKK